MISKKRLIELLEGKGLYEPTDEGLIDEIITNQKIMAEAKRDIRTRGNLTPINKEETLFNQNPSVAIYNGALKNILNLSRKFGLSPRDRAELKLEGGEEDAFNL